MDGMKQFDVTVWDGDAEWVFQCWADDAEHAQEQAMNEGTVQEVRAVRLTEWVHEVDLGTCPICGGELEPREEADGARDSKVHFVDSGCPDCGAEFAMEYTVSSVRERLLNDAGEDDGYVGPELLPSGGVREAVAALVEAAQRDIYTDAPECQEAVQALSDAVAALVALFPTQEG